MSTKRRESAKHIRQDGKTLCSCGCGREPGKGRWRWHSDDCVEQWKIRNDPGYVRELVLKRDQGICSVCGCDAVADYRAFVTKLRDVRRLIDWLEQHRRFNTVWSAQHGRMIFPHDYDDDNYPAIQRERERLEAKWMDGERAWTSGRTTGWDADHIVPVVEGGGQCGLENFRTLCHPCHKAASKALARRLAKRRRATEPQLMFAESPCAADAGG